MVDQLQEWPDILRACDQARRRIRAMFEDYRRRYVDGWEPRECPLREEFR